MSTSLDHYRDDPGSMAKFNERRRDLFKTTRSAALDITKGRSGRVFLKWLAKICGAREDPFTVGDSDVTAYKLGRQSVWLELTHLLHMTDETIERYINGPPGSEDK